MSGSTRGGERRDSGAGAAGTGSAGTTAGTGTAGTGTADTGTADTGTDGAGSGAGGGGAGGAGAGRRRYGNRTEQRGWYWYDWANSAFYTTAVTVFGGRYLTGLAAAAADPAGFIHPLGISVRAGSFYPYVISVSAVLQVILMPIVGALVDRTGRRKAMLTQLTLVGAAATVGFGLVSGADYALGGLLFLIASVAYGCAIVVYNSFLPEIAAPDERDKVSSRGWAFGYIGGGLLLAVNLALFQLAEGGGLPFGPGTAAQVSIASAGVWWALFTLPTLAMLRDHPPAGASPEGGTLSAGFRQLRTTFRGLARAPVTFLFLGAYLLYNDGIQTVIAQSSVYADIELGLPASVAIIAVLLVQFVGIFGAWLLGALGERFGAKRVVLASLVIWIGVLGYAFFMPAGRPGQFYLLAALIGMVLGGSQALSRSLFSHMTPRGKEAEYFSLYEISDRGTSWLGSLLFGLALQFTGSYRSAVVSLLVFFVLGFVLLARTNVRAAAAEAGNPAPARM